MGGTVSAPSVSIDAPPAAVWALLLDVRRYASWRMPFTVRMELHTAGAALPQRGNAITEHVVLDPRRSSSIRLQRVVVTEVLERPDEGLFRLCWESVMGARWVLHAVRVQEVREGGRGGCVYETSDTMSGLLAPLVVTLYGGQVSRGFAAQGEALKAHAEAGAGGAAAR